MDARQLRIVFMGTPEFAVPSLRALVAGGYNVVGVVTAPDKPAGRGRQLRESDVKTAARELGLPVLQPERLKAPEFVGALRALRPDLGIVIAPNKYNEHYLETKQERMHHTLGLEKK